MKWYERHPQLKPSEAFSADAGYFSEDNIKACEKNKMTPCISFGKEQHNQPLEERFKEAEPLPQDPTSVEKMKHRLQATEGKVIYAQRKSVIEPVFGIINPNYALEITHLLQSISTWAFTKYHRFTYG